MKKKNIVMLMSACTSLLVLSTAFSLAWYVSSDVAYISSVNIELSTHANLRISLTGESGSYKERIEKEELDELGYFLPVSSMNSETWMDEKSATPLFYENGTSILPSSGIPYVNRINAGYFQEEFYLMCDRASYAVIDPESAIAPDQAKNHQAALNLIDQYPGMTVDELEQKLNNLIYSLRVSILVDDEEYYNYSIYDFYKNGETYFGGLLDGDMDGYYDYYTSTDGTYKEMLYGQVTNRGENNSNLVYEDVNANDSSLTGEHTWYNAKTASNVKHLDVEASINNGVEIAKEKATSLTEISQDITDINYGGKSNSEVEYKIPLKAYEPRHIVLSVYMEGWDYDNINITKGASFNMDLAFMLLPGMVIL